MSIRYLLFILGLSCLASAPALAETPRRAVLPAPGESGAAETSSEDAVREAAPFSLGLLADGSTAERENRELAALLTAYAASGKPYAFDWLDDFLERHPDSAWKGALSLNRGLIERHNGFIAACFASFETAWKSLEDSEDRMLRSYADRALAELIAIKAGLGRMEELESLFAKAEGRRFRGKSAQLVASAREGLASMEKFPERSFNCGPAALLNLLASLGEDAAADPRIMARAATADGLSLRQVAELADEVGFENYVLAYREDGGIQLPAILHWKEGHFSALLREERGRYLIEDPTLGDAMWVPREAVEAEASGYFLLGRSELPEGWREVSPEEAGEVRGKGRSNTYELGSTKPSDLKNCRNNGNPGMPGHGVHLLALSVNITDTPVWVNTPYGPSMRFTATYNQREISLPFTDRFGFMGTNWTHNWQSWIEVDPGDGSTVPLLATRAVAGGGQENFLINAAADGYQPQRDSQAELVPLFQGGMLDGFELNFPDGSRLMYRQEQQFVANFNARYFLSAVVDPYGNTATIDYDADDRIRSVDSDATAAVDLKFVYEFDGAGQPLWPSPASSGIADNLIRAVVGPQGRYAEFDYDTDFMVKRIVDMAGLETTFSYARVADNVYVDQYATPYGATTFDYPPTNGEDEPVRAVVITDPGGQKERLEYSQAPITVPGELVPPGAATGPHLYDDLNTFYWDKRAMETAVRPDGSVDYDQATLYHWMLADSQRASSVLHSVKRPLENREWLIYDDSPDGGATVGETDLPSATSRYVRDESGGTALRTTGFEYNSLGRVTRTVDPLGRELEIAYAANGIDLLNVQQRTGPGANDFATLSSFDYDADNDVNDDFPRLPSLIDGADGVRLDMTFNSKGQILSVTRQEPDGQGGFTNSGTTDYTYDTQGIGETYGYLLKVEGPSISGQRPTTNYTYDAYGRVRTATDTDDFKLTYSYDDLDRITKVDYPDGTYVAHLFEPLSEGLDLVGFVDRMGRMSQFLHDDVGRVVQSIDPKGQSTIYQWCGCGSLNTLIDPKGHATTWLRDVQGRLEKKIYPDNSEISYAYEPESGLLSKVTDQRGFYKEFKYFVDGNIEEISFDDGGTSDPDYIDAPTVNYTYDPYFNRTATLTTEGDPDDYGYQYYGFTGNGNANRLETVTISKIRNTQAVNTDIDYVYDSLGRLLTRSFKGNTETYAYDLLDRLDALNDPLGDFDYGYDGLTSRILSVQHSVSGVDGIRTDLSYQSKVAGGLERKVPFLSSITHSNPSKIVSAHAYQRNANGWIDLWQQYVGSQWESHAYRYDQKGQLETDRKYDGLDQNSPLLESHEFRYDLAGNRTLAKDSSDQLNDEHNNLNQLGGRSSEGSVLFNGTISEPGRVLVQRLDGSNNVIETTEAKLYGGNEFYANVDLQVGTNTVRVKATDIHGESSSQDYSVPLAADSGDSLIYDDAGNLTTWTKSNGMVVEYAWDAANRLREVKVDSVSIKTFEYDGAGRMVRSSNGTQADDYFWDGLERLGREQITISSGSVSVYRRYLAQGFTHSDGVNPIEKYFTLRDHLGSTREVLDDSYSIVARYDYSAWGKVTKLSGSIDADRLYTGHLYFSDTDTSLHLAPYRTYQPELGGWLSREPVGELSPDGPNLYWYGRNSPVNMKDPSGLWNVWNPLTWGLPKQPGENPWSPLDSSAEWGATREGATKGAAAYADGFIPGSDPFRSAGIYNICEDAGTSISQSLGQVGFFAATTSAGGAVANLYKVPKYLYHFTSSTGGAGINAVGGISATARGLYGSGTYLTRFTSPFVAKLQGAGSTQAVVRVSTEGLKVSRTLFPGTFIVRNASILLK